ncbi:hypothetical protein Mapa_000841 [Marchantia paleacea]|nr:hypothetical protein Mapa_000841 [Marchantia paleacea]
MGEKLKEELAHEVREAVINGHMGLVAAIVREQQELQEEAEEFNIGIWKQELERFQLQIQDLQLKVEEMEQTMMHQKNRIFDAAL